MITSRGQNEKPSGAGHSNLTNTMNIVPESQRELYQKEGYMILPGVIPPDLLTMLREECSYYLGYYDSMMDAKGVQSEGISHRGKRYFINNRYRLSSRLWEFIFSPLMAEVARGHRGLRGLSLPRTMGGQRRGAGDEVFLAPGQRLCEMV